MKPTLVALILGLLPCSFLFGQMLAVDRGVPEVSGIGGEAIRVGWTKSPGFVADHFTLGRRGEVWIVDSIRTYSMPESNAPIEDLYEKTMLFGGIEAQPEQPGQPPQPQCDCHNLMTIQSNALGAIGNGRADAAASRLGPNLWQVDFRNLHWSVPGGVPIQFGATAISRHVSGGSSAAWFNRGNSTAATHGLRVFDDKGKEEGLLAGMSAVDPAVEMNVQVWAHKMTPVSMRMAGAMIDVTVPGSDLFDPQRIDVASLRFGTANVTPESSRIAVKDGKTELLVSFRRAATGIRGSQLSVCLSGREQDGTPFEGCDQLISR